MAVNGGLLCICARFLGLVALAEVYACIKYRFTSGISAIKMVKKGVPKHCTKRTIMQALHEVQDGESMYFVTGESMDSVTKQCRVYRHRYDAR